MEHIKQALLALNGKKDSDWTEGGRPSLKAVQGLAKDASITQAQLDEAAGDFQRPEQPEKKEKVTKVRVVDNRAIDKEEKPDPVKDVRMVATERGYYGGALREAGDSFMFTGTPGQWMREETAEEAKERERQDKLLAKDGVLRDNVWAAEISKAKK